MVILALRCNTTIAKAGIDGCLEHIALDFLAVLDSFFGWLISFGSLVNLRFAKIRNH